MNGAAILNEVLELLAERLALLSPAERFALVDALIEDLCIKAQELDEAFVERNETHWRAPVARGNDRALQGAAAPFAEMPSADETELKGVAA